MKTFFARLALLISATFIGWSPMSVARAEEHPLAPDWQLEDVAGHAVRLSDYRGKVVILDFWATWCPPCRMEIPGLINLQKKDGPKGLVVIGVSMDEGVPKDVAAFMQKSGMNFRVVMGNAKIAFLYGGIDYLPTTFIIDRAGRVAAVHGGYADAATFEAEIKPLL